MQKMILIPVEQYNRMNIFLYRLTICSMVINCLWAAAFG